MIYRQDDPIDYNEMSLSTTPFLGLSWPLVKSLLLHCETAIELGLNNYKGSQAHSLIHTTSVDLLW